MKKLFVLFTLILSFSVVSAQDYVVEDGYMTMRKVVENTNLSADECYQQMKVFFGKFFKNVNEVCKVDTPSKQVYKFVCDVAQINKGLGVYHTFHADYELEIAIKDNRMRVTLVAYRVDCLDMHPYEGYNPANSYPILGSHDIWGTGVTKKQAQTIFDGLLKNMQSLMTQIDGALQSSTEDEW